MKIILLGYMGCGKTTIGAALATALNVAFLDLDAVIEHQIKLSVPEIFNKHGAIFFRKKEHEILKALISKNQKVVLALGGGTPNYYNHMDLFNETDDVVSIYLKASIPVLAARLVKEKDARPLISHLETKEELQEFIGKHLFERSPDYSKADITLMTDALSPKAIREQLVLKLLEYNG